MTERPSRRKTLRKALAFIGLVFGVTVAAYTISLFDLLLSLEYQLYDLNFLLRGGRRVTDGKIAVVLIDQKTADSLRFPFDRRYYARLIETLNDHGAKWIVFDVDFSSAGASPASDSLFYDAVQGAGNVVLSGKVDLRYHPRLKRPQESITRPTHLVSPPGTPFGIVNDFIDHDGITRRYPLFLAARDTTFLSLGLKVFTISEGDASDSIPRLVHGRFRYAGLSIPTYPGEANTALLNYYGRAGSFPSYSFLDVIRGVYDTGGMLDTLSDAERALLAELGTEDLLAELTGESPFRDKIVLVGASAEDLQDNKFTPFFTSADPRKTPGVEVHAHALQMMMSRAFLSTVSIGWVLAATLAVSLLMYYIGRRWAHWLGLAAAAVLAVGIMGAGLYLFIREGLWLREMPILLAVILGYPTNLLYSIIQAQQEKAMIRGMFSRYVPPKVVDSLIADPSRLKLGGVKQRLTVLFTDVAGFTTISEKLSPEELVALLNEYLTAMTEVILDHNGIIDKYEGDLVMAEFGAPIWFEDHAARCCRAALEMQRRLSKLRHKWRAEGKVELYSRVGINTGEMITGNMGSDQVFDFTVMGDAVNLASRLEGANKNYGSTIMIGAETQRDIGESFITRPLDLLRVKGKNEPVAVFELLAEQAEELAPDILQAVESYRTGIAAYRSRLFTQALEAFELAVQHNPNDQPAQVYSERCRKFLHSPPPSGWDGVYTLSEK